MAEPKPRSQSRTNVGTLAPFDDDSAASFATRLRHLAVGLYRPAEVGKAPSQKTQVTKKAFPYALANVPLSWIRDDFKELNPRSPNVRKIAQLASEIQRDGLLVPLTVAYVEVPPSESPFALVDGRHRLHAIIRILRAVSGEIGSDQITRADLRAYPDGREWFHKKQASLRHHLIDCKVLLRDDDESEGDFQLRLRGMGMWLNTSRLNLTAGDRDAQRLRRALKWYDEQVLRGNKPTEREVCRSLKENMRDACVSLVIGNLIAPQPFEFAEGSDQEYDYSPFGALLSRAYSEKIRADHWFKLGLQVPGGKPEGLKETTKGKPLSAGNFHEALGHLINTLGYDEPFFSAARKDEIAQLEKLGIALASTVMRWADLPTSLRSVDTTATLLSKRWNIVAWVKVFSGWAEGQIGKGSIPAWRRLDQDQLMEFSWLLGEWIAQEVESALEGAPGVEYNLEALRPLGEDAGSSPEPCISIPTEDAVRERLKDSPLNHRSPSESEAAFKEFIAARGR